MKCKNQIDEEALYSMLGLHGTGNVNKRQETCLHLLQTGDQGGMDFTYRDGSVKMVNSGSQALETPGSEGSHIPGVVPGDEDS